MRKSLLLIAGILFNAAFVSAQVPTHRCGTDEAMHELFESDPAAKQRYENNLRELNKEAQEAEDAKQAAVHAAKMSGKNPDILGLYPLDTIPVVFHILHQYGPENIPDQVVIDALAQINIDYQKLDADTSQIEPTFIPIADRVNVVFALAKKDPSGNCTNGIIRHYDPNTIWNRTQANGNGWNNYAYSGTTPGKWDPKKYLNVYIVKDIYTGNGTSGGIVVGYTYLPGTWASGDKRDAIVYNYQFLNGHDARSLAHEMGHWLNLIHTFGSTNSPGSIACMSTQNDDFVGDTPWTKGYFSTCPKSNPTTGCSAIENIENIMDYSDCPKMFTAGQVVRMRSMLSSSTVGRNNLTTALNKASTGIDGSASGNCAPVADFAKKSRFICEGASVTLNDASWGGVVASRLWTLNGGSPATDTAAQPLVTYSAPGIYPVDLSVSNANGSSSKNEPEAVIVSPLTGALTVNYSEGFETGTFPFNDWFISSENGGAYWDQATLAAATGNSSLYLDNFNNSSLGSDEFITPSFNLTGVTGTMMSFKLAFAFRLSSNQNIDRLVIYSSTNCGQTWTLRRTIGGAGLSTTPTYYNTSDFIPTASEWRTENVTLTSTQISNKPNVRFKFEYTYDSGNNIYIDDINLTGTVDIAKATAESANIQVYPNPSRNNTYVSFTTQTDSKIIVEVLDVTGRIIQTIEDVMEAGDHQVQLSNSLASGTYFVRLTLDNTSITRKVVMN
jgi:PKD repeat protein